MKPELGQSSAETNQRTSPDRRDFLIQSSATAMVAATVAAMSSSGHAASMLDAVQQQPLIDSPFLGHQWQTLNPGYWCIKNRTLRRSDRCDIRNTARWRGNQHRGVGNTTQADCEIAADQNAAVGRCAVCGCRRASRAGDLI